MKRSAKQKAATERAWTILRLRGAYHLFVEIGSHEGMRVVDQELIKMNATPEGTRG